MARPLRHRWDIVNLLQDHRDGLTFDQIVKHFAPPPVKNPTAKQKAEAPTAILVLRGSLLRAIEKLQREGELILEDGKYKLNLALSL